MAIRQANGHHCAQRRCGALQVQAAWRREEALTYSVYANDQLLFATGSDDAAHAALSASLSLDVNAAGSLSFVIPPCNALHGKLRKLKDIMAVYQDGYQLFRGRVTETSADTYNQQTVYCVGDKAILRDSQQKPYTYSGTAIGLFQRLLSAHNEQMGTDPEKNFTPGIVTAVSDTASANIETSVWADTYSELETRLLNAYGGYLRTRRVGTTKYLDWVRQYGADNAQPVEFSVNLLDLTARADAADVFTVLIPLGASCIGEDGKYTEPVNIGSVNGGQNYIQDDDAVAMYGRIWRSQVWSEIDDPARLLAKGREYLKTGIALETLTLKAVDMHFVDGNVQPIRIGDKVRVLSSPHGIDRVYTCTQIELDMFDPENTVYTFGEKPKTLTENVVRNGEDVSTLTGRGSGGGGRGKSVQDELRDIIRWAKIKGDENKAHILLTAGELDKVAQRLSMAEIDIDGANAKIDLKASQTSVDALGQRVSSAEIAIDGANAEIALKVNKNGVISAINVTSEEIKIQASRINLSGYVTASQMSAEFANLQGVWADNFASNSIQAQYGDFTNINLINKKCSWKSRTVQTSIPDFTKATVTLANGNAISVVTGWADAPSGKRSTLYYLSYD